ncbi:low molecular weight protein-tyrosine-phosphatase [Moheibacter sp.]|uniref:low molecular weight protein-tyrosine-phosphatase n=1 Tax=Moheibacter sp. TaxID=1965316 RepID=UPI003C732FB6
MKILMVCLGNICRSPLAEGILRSKLNDKFTIDSAGTGPWHIGKSPDKRSVSVAEKYGIDISTQRARQFSAADFDKFDLIFVMDESNYSDVLAHAKNDDERKKVRLILENRDVPDPYFGEDDGFEEVYRLLEEAADKIAQELESE